ncbi:MAG: SDR family NAD(P)-dependent oxidoreductase [Alphaproteobacteria bacterium]
MTKKLFCFGVGFSGLEILKHAKLSGFEVSGCVRSVEKAKKLSTETGFDIVDINNVDLTGITHILNTVPTNGMSDFIYDQFIEQIKSLKTLKWFGYMSTTGVYGNTNGEMVDETSPLNPSGIRGKQRVAVEKLWLDNVKQTHIFRLPGIYGAGRSALDIVQSPKARAIKKDGQIFSRIHIYDIAQTVVASMKNPNFGNIYNVCDDLPCDNVAVLSYACELQNIKMIPVIPFEQAEMSEMARSFYSDKRRVSNNKIKKELGIKLKYPTYKIGLQAILQSKS